VSPRVALADRAHFVENKRICPLRDNVCPSAITSFAHGNGSETPIRGVNQARLHSWRSMSVCVELQEEPADVKGRRPRNGMVPARSKSRAPPNDPAAMTTVQASGREVDIGW